MVIDDDFARVPQAGWVGSVGWGAVGLSDEIAIRIAGGCAETVKDAHREILKGEWEEQAATSGA